MNIPNSVTIRLARPADMFPISRMSRELIEAGLGWSWTPARVAREILSADTVVLTSCDGDRVIAFAIMHFGDEAAHLNLIAVEPEYRRTGIGRRQMVWLEKSALTAGIRTIGLELRAGNQIGIRFYHSLGYRETGVVPGYYRGLEAAIRMARTLRREVAQNTE